MPDTDPLCGTSCACPISTRRCAFYSAVFGWEFEDNTLGKSITHRGVVIGGVNVTRRAFRSPFTPNR